MPYKDPVKQKEAKHQHYLKNKKKYLSRMQRQRKAIRDWLNEIKSQYKCCRCGISDYRVLDFHHIKNKLGGIAQLASNRLSRDSILKEIKRCQCLCSNCHRIVHWEEIH